MKYTVLGFLIDKPMHGYALKRALSPAFAALSPPVGTKRTSRNGAAVIVFPGSAGRAAQARVLVDRGYGVLMLDMRGYASSDGDPNMFGWSATKDVDAGVAIETEVDAAMRGEEAEAQMFDAKLAALAGTVPEGPDDALALSGPFTAEPPADCVRSAWWFNFSVAARAVGP